MQQRVLSTRGEGYRPFGATALLVLRASLTNFDQKTADVLDGSSEATLAPKGKDARIPAGIFAMCCITNRCRMPYAPVAV
jgi:hypothetical protein